jgi:aryl-alcohol dehydrogenase-like predicted oxidoreductase
LQLWAKQKHQRSILALAVRWVLDKGISIALWEARTPEQLNDLNTALDWKLNVKDFREIEKMIYETVKHPVGPEFMAPPKHRI